MEINARSFLGGRDNFGEADWDEIWRFNDEKGDERKEFRAVAAMDMVWCAD